MADFKYNIGDNIKDDKRDITIINRQYFKRDIGGGGYKKYKYRCNKCGYECGESYKDGEFQNEYWIYENHLINGTGCACCQGRAVVTGINDMKTTRPDIIKYIKNENDIIRYTANSKKVVTCVCTECNTIKKMKIDNLSTNGFSCPKCSDGISFGEKVIYNLLHYYKVDFIKELSKKDFKWCKNYRYDFYIKKENIIIEVNGKQHSTNAGFESLGGRTLLEEIENDKIKKDKALKNGVTNYICLDYKDETFECLKESIINSELLKLLNLNNVDWDYLYEQSLKSVIVSVCKYRNEFNIRTSDLSSIFNLSIPTITKYLKIGDELGLCHYNPKEEMKYSKADFTNDAPNSATPIKCIENDTYFKSVNLCVKVSENVFGIKLNATTIRKVISGVFKQHRNYHFCNISKEEFNLAINQGLPCYGRSFIL